jgi:Xaa-Pro aminopeptidase
MASADVPADRPVSVPATPAALARPTFITWLEGDTHPIEPGMCFSIEPGIYLPGRFGVRIEDIVTATKDGGRRLNNTSHEMRIVS